MSRRLARLNEQLKRELSVLISTRLRDHRIGLVTVVAVEVAADMGSARVFIRHQGGGDDVVGDDAEARDSLRRLAASAPFLRKALGESLHLRRVPELRFRRDRSPEHVRRIEEILAELAAPEDVATGDVASTDVTAEDGRPPRCPAARLSRPVRSEGYVIGLDKPRGPTSHEVVAQARRMLDERRIGHCGTLDPLASGLLVLCVGRATRLVEYLVGLDKTYLAIARLGIEDRHP